LIFKHHFDVDRMFHMFLNVFKYSLTDIQHLPAEISGNRRGDGMAAWPLPAAIGENWKPW
jgi:hypothetical protein